MTYQTIEDFAVLYFYAMLGRHRECLPFSIRQSLGSAGHF